MELSEDAKYGVKVNCDDTVYMMFDLEQGGHLSPKGEEVTEINDLWKFTYKSQLVSEDLIETAQGSYKNIVKNFTIKVWNDDTVILDFDTRGNESKFTVRTYDGTRVGMFLSILESYRREKFGK